MKAIILSAGRGDRLRPLTDATPKPLLSAGGQHLIEYLIQSLVSAGIDNIIINTAYLAAQFPQALGNGERYGAVIHYVAEQDGALETAGGIINALPLLGDEPFLVVNGDIWTDYPFAKLADKPANNYLGHGVLINNPPHNPKGDFALTGLGMVAEKGSQYYTYSGIGVYHPRLFLGLNKGKRALKSVLLPAVAEAKISGELYHGTWLDIGTLTRLNDLRARLTNT